MKKVGVLLVFLFISLVVGSFSELVGAQGFFGNLQNGIEPFSKSIMDPIEKMTANTQVFVKFLFFILVFLIVVAIVSRIPLFRRRETDDSGVGPIGILFSLVVSILSVYFIPADLILPLLNPYTAMGVAFISIIPFALMVVFTQSVLTNVFVRQVVWMFFALTLLFMCIYTGALQYNDPTVNGNPAFSAVYGIMSVLALGMLYFNNTIRRKMWTGRLGGLAERARRDRQMRELGRQLEREEALSRSGMTTQAGGTA